MQPQSWKEALLATPGPQRRSEYLILLVKGFCMGIADLIPGVSGGTIAFITGIYDHFLEAIASLNKNFFLALLKFDFKAALSQIHLRFLIPLFAGILTAIMGLARLMHYLLLHHPVPTWALFFGLISASIVVIWRHLEHPSSLRTIFFLLLGTIGAYIIVGLIPVETPESYWFIYLCGIIGITAMILPGISGSFLLLILGKYEFVTGAVKSPFADGNTIILLVFVSGSITGLLSFSKLLNYFLHKHREATMAVLTGILIGSMRKVWPWKEVLQSKVIRGKVRVLQDRNILPTEFNTEFYIAIALIVIGLLFVLFLEKKSQKIN